MDRRRLQKQKREMLQLAIAQGNQQEGDVDTVVEE